MADSYYWSPNIDLSDYYRGSMTPPAMPDYNAIIGAPGSVGIPRPLSGSDGLSSVSRPTVPINPQTGMPYMTTASASAVPALGRGYQASGAVNYQAPRAPSIANPVRDLGSPQYGVPGSGGGVLTKSGLPPASTVEKQYTSPLVPRSPGSVAGSYKLGAGGFGSGAVTAAPKTYSDPVHRHNVNLSDDMGQSFADGLGMSVVTPNGKTYKPKIEGSSIMPSGKVAQLRGGRNNVSGSLSANDTRGPLSRGLGLKTSGFGGLLGSLFGGMLGTGAAPQAVGLVPGVGSAAAAPSLGYNAAYSQTPTGDGQGNNAFSTSDGFWGGARSLTE